MCIASSTAIGMMKIGIMLLMMWTGKPAMINAPIVRITDTIAMIIGEIISTSLRKNTSISRKITSIAAGAEIAI